MTINTKKCNLNFNTGVHRILVWLAKYRNFDCKQLNKGKHHHKDKPSEQNLILLENEPRLKVFLQNAKPQNSKTTRTATSLIHPPDELIDVILTVSSISSFDIVVPLLLHAPQWCLELKWPQEVISFPEMRSHGHDLMDEVFHADDAILAQSLYINRLTLLTHFNKRNFKEQEDKYELDHRYNQEANETCSMTEFSVKAILCLFNFPNPLL